MTAGRLVQERQRSGLTLGRFVYGRSYLARRDAVPFDPVELKLSDRTYETVALGGVFGALRDTGPDYWGRRVIERHVGKPQLGELANADGRREVLGMAVGPSEAETFCGAWRAGACAASS